MGNLIAAVVFFAVLGFVLNRLTGGGVVRAAKYVWSWIK